MRRHRVIFFFSIFFFSIFFFSSFSFGKTTATVPVAEKGVLNLTGWDFESKGMVKLSGEWEFYWNQLLTPEDFKNLSNPPKEYVPVPSDWKKSATGYGTIHLKIQGVETVQQVMSLYVQDMLTEYRMWVNGKLVARNGVVGTSKLDSVPAMAIETPVVPAQIDGSDTIEIVLQLSNYQGPHIGIWESIQLGTEQQIKQKYTKNVAYDLFLFGSLFVMGLYHLVLFSLRIKDKSTLYFGLLTLVLGLRGIITGSRYLIVLLPSLPWEVAKRLEIITIYLALALFARFLYVLFQSDFHKKVMQAFVVVSLAFALTTLVAPPSIFLSILMYFFLVIALFFIYTLSLLFVALYKKRQYVVWVVFGYLAVILATVLDMMGTLGIIPQLWLTPLGVFTFIFFQSVLLSIRFSAAFKNNELLSAELKTINDNLEETVRQRTAALQQKTNDIQSMLQNIPQGILTIVSGKVIHPEYSSYLEQIFETKEIAGKNVMNLIFDKSTVGSDFLAQVDTTIDSCIGEEAMNFEFNSHLFITELDKETDSGQVKSLELSWSPINNEKGICEKLMVCIRDVTQLKQLAAEAGKQKRELEMIGQILAVNQEKFHAFIESSTNFIVENEKLIKDAGDKNPDLIGQLFRNMHTIKGNARTFGLLHLTNLVHETEQEYDVLRKVPESKWDQERLLEQLKLAKAAIEEYSHLNDVKLGRKGPGRRGSVDKFLMVEKDHIQKAVEDLDLSDTSDDVSVLRRAVKKVRHMLQLIGTEKIGDILIGIFDSLPSLAKELNKEAPQVVIEDNGVVIRNQIANLLKNVFMHLYRNSMDHGLETPDKRIAQGKPAAGTIRLKLSLSDGRLWFRLSDDGRGLALGFIRKKAIENKLITEEQNVPDEQVAQLIFASGFSTAEKVTEVSGRGVGMDAVKGFIEREGGTLQLQFMDDIKGDYRQFETLLSLPAKFAMQREL